jgi:hypothetical protein
VRTATGDRSTAALGPSRGGSIPCSDVRVTALKAIARSERALVIDGHSCGHAVLEEGSVRLGSSAGRAVGPAGGLTVFHEQDETSGSPG